MMPLRMESLDGIEGTTWEADILGLAQFRAQVMFGVLRHASTSSALVLILAQNAAQLGAQFGAQDFQCL